MLRQPTWIRFDNEAKSSIRFLWDDTRAVLDFNGDPSQVLAASLRMSLRARLVLCTGLYEWIVWRFDGLHGREEPRQIAEAAWCATVDPRYMTFFELPRSAWLGPVEGPLWCASMWLQPAMSRGHLFPQDVYDALALLLRAAIHVLPCPDRFQAWLGCVLERLIHVSPVSLDNPFDDVFNRRISERLGPLIGPSLLDPAGDFDPRGDIRFLTQVLQCASEEHNPFLSSYEELEEAGFFGKPYVLAT